MTTPIDAHKGLHSEQGALQGEHPGRSRNPLIKVRDLAWLEFEKPDLVRAEAFARAFGFTTVLHTADELQLRGTDAGLTVRDRPARAAVAVRRPRVRGTGEGRCRAARPSDRRADSRAAGSDRRCRGGPDRSERDSGPRRGRHSRTARAARPAAADLQLRA